MKKLFLEIQTNNHACKIPMHVCIFEKKKKKEILMIEF